MANYRERQTLRALGLRETSENTAALHGGPEAIRKRLEREGRRRP